MKKEKLTPTSNYAIICRSKKEYIDVLTIMEKEGLTWCSGDKPTLHYNFWEDYTQGYLALKYSNDFTFVSVLNENYYVEEYGRINIEASEFIKLKTEFVLPEKWCIKWGSEENYKIINGYLNTISPHSWQYTYDFHAKAYVDCNNNYYGDIGKAPEGYTEITFETFKEHVLKSTETLTIKTNKTMKKEFAISGSVVLQEAFIKECGITYKGEIKEDYNEYPHLCPTSKSDQLCSCRNVEDRIEFGLPGKWYEALDYVKEYFAEEKIEIAGYTAEFSKDEVAFSCNHLTTKDLKTLKDMMALAKKLEYNILVEDDRVTANSYTGRTLSPALIDELLAGIKAFGK